MPDKSRKSYMALADILEKLADGAKKHGTEEDYPVDIIETNLRALKKELEDTREQCILTASEASKQQDIYDKKEKEISAKVSNYKTTIYGHYGKKNKEVQDFGLKPYKGKTSKKAKDQAAAAS